MRGTFEGRISDDVARFEISLADETPHNGPETVEEGAGMDPGDCED